MIAGVIAGGRPYSSSAVTDPYWSSVASLLHFDGADLSTTFTDQKAATWSASGTPKLTTATKKYGTAALLLDGSSYIYRSSGSDTDLSSSNFTWEAWLNIDVAAGDVGIFFALSGGGLTIETSSGAVRVGSRNIIPNIVTSSASVTKGVWFHLAIVRSSDVLTIYIDGVDNGSSSFAGTLGNGAQQLGAYTSVSKYMLGKIDDYRLTVGTARYTANFTPPTAAFPNS